MTPEILISQLRAIDGTRTRDPRLGKPMLYQLSHYRKKKEPDSSDSLLPLRADSRTRTGDLRITNALLYQLSHIGNYKRSHCSKAFAKVI